MNPLRTSAAATAALLAMATLRAQDPQAAATPASLDLTDLSLEELMQVPVEVGGRQAESLGTSAAAVFVLTEADIRRSGMRTVPDLLRLVPGLLIAQDVPGAFGFASRLGEYEYAGMLVLLDGQRLYNTLLRREFFQAIDLPIESIERIEVVRGPGGARWGDKAAQGVVNIVTKKAAACQGLLLTGLVGSEDRYTGSFRFGASTGQDSSFYVYGKAAERDGGYPTVSGDHWSSNRIGGRFDAQVAPGVDLTVDGEYHDSFLGDSYQSEPGFSVLNFIRGGHLKARLHAAHDNGDWSEVRIAGEAYDQDIREFDAGTPYDHLIWQEHLFDLTAQHSFALAEDHSLTVGLGLRSVLVDYFYTISDFGDRYNETRGDLFAAWDWQLLPEVKVTLGGNLGYTDGKNVAGADAQPDVRIAWTPSPDVTVWGAISGNREADRRYHDSGIIVKRQASKLLAYELGLRRRWGESFMLQVDTFAYEVGNQLNGYDTDPGSGATLYLTDGRTHAFGGELTGSWRPLTGLRATAFLATTQADSEHFDPTWSTIENDVPHTRGGLTVGYELAPGLDVSSNLLYTERHAGIPTWWRLDLRLGWTIGENTHLDLVGQNLTDPHHVEYFYEEQSQRGAYLLLTHQF